MFYVGLDIHTKHITICVLSGGGKVRQRCQVQRAETMLMVLRELPGPFEVCYEASTGYGRFFVMWAMLKHGTLWKEQKQTLAA